MVENGEYTCISQEECAVHVEEDGMKKCFANCAAGGYSRTVVTSPTPLCSNSCPDSHHYYNENTAECLDGCPEKLFRIEGSEWKCQASCELWGDDGQHGTQMRCVDACSEITEIDLRYREEDQCVAQCSTKKYVAGVYICLAIGETCSDLYTELADGVVECAGLRQCNAFI